MANDAKEIYEAVIGQVRKELAKDFEEMGQHAGKIAGTYDRRIKGLESRVHVLEEQLTEVEKILKKENLVENRIKIQKNQKKTNFSSQEKVDMSSWYIQFGYRLNGWVYYVNYDMKDFLYRVRVDGRENQQLTDYSLYRPGGGFNVKDGKLFFRDKYYKEHCISIS